MAADFVTVLFYSLLYYFIGATELPNNLIVSEKSFFYSFYFL